nr:hypothetical protein [uncultured Dyadobacter sp.]
MKNTISKLLLICISACSVGEKQRPPGVPQSAIWKGGVDGGVWIEFVSVRTTSVEANIFFEDGGIWESGTFKKQGNCDIEPLKIVEEIVAFDGERLLTYQQCSFDK